MLPIANRPHINRVVDLLIRHGIDEMVLATSYLAKAFADFVRETRDRGV